MRKDMTCELWYKRQSFTSRQCYSPDNSLGSNVYCKIMSEGIYTHGVDPFDSTFSVQSSHI